MHRRLFMEVKIWEISYAKEDIETILGRGITIGEWNIVADELYNNDTLYNDINKQVLKIVQDAIE
jgi:hypothetical protein